jgi:thiamine-monophosphate kinase
VYVAGTPGDSAMGLRLLRKRRKKVHSFMSANADLKLIKKHLMPEPVPISNISKITAMIDISDGILKDLCHICDESKVCAVIYKEKIPLSREIRSVAGKLRINPFDLALKGGEDYVLLFTAPQNMKTDAFRIGEITKKGRFMVDENGRKAVLRPEGYEHFIKGSSR